jgi:hypothetical protein
VAMNIIIVLWDVIMYNVLFSYQCFRRDCCLNLCSYNKMMEVRN